MRTKLNNSKFPSPPYPFLKPIETIHENQWFTLQNRGGYYVLEYKNVQVAVLPIVENHSIVMVRVKRPVIADITLELPAGGAKNEESPVAAGARELREETGIDIREFDRFQLLPPLAVCPNRYSSLPYIYQIHISEREFNLRENHDEEVISVENIPFEEVKRLIAQGEIYVSLPIAIISRFFLQQKAI